MSNHHSQLNKFHLECENEVGLQVENPDNISAKKFSENDCENIFDDRQSSFGNIIQGESYDCHLDNIKRVNDNDIHCNCDIFYEKREITNVKIEKNKNSSQ